MPCADDGCCRSNHEGQLGNDRDGVRQQVHRDVVALEDPDEDVGHSVPLDCGLPAGVEHGSMPMSINSDLVHEGTLLNHILLREIHPEFADGRLRSCLPAFTGRGTNVLPQSALAAARLELDDADFTDVATMTRITGGNFRLVHRLLVQMSASCASMG